MVTKQLHELKPWDLNPRSIDHKGLERLKKQLRTFGQYKPLIITEENIIIGGNMRYKALEELGIGEVQCIVVGFLKEEEGYAVQIDDEIHREKFFPTKEDAMMELSLSDNDRAGQYDEDKVIGMMSNFSIEWKDYSIDTFKPVSIDEWKDKVLEKEAKAVKYLITVEATDEADKQAIIEKLKGQGLKVKTKK